MVSNYTVTFLFSTAKLRKKYDICKKKRIKFANFVCLFVVVVLFLLCSRQINTRFLITSFQKSHARVAQVKKIYNSKIFCRQREGAFCPKSILTNIETRRSSLCTLRNTWQSKRIRHSAYMPMHPLLSVAGGL